MWMPCGCHVDAMSMPCRCHVDVMSMSCRCHVDVMSMSCRCHVDVMSMSCRCHVDVMSMSCRCHVDVMSMSCRCHVDVMSMSCRCHVDVMSMSCRCHVDVMSMSVLGLAGGGAEAAIHAMNDIFQEEETDGVLLIDASNAFNQMNRSTALHNIRIIFKEISLYIINTYRSPSRLFICGGEEILSQEGTTQGDPLAMPWYSVNSLIIIESLRIEVPSVKQVWLADDSAGAGTITSLNNWYKVIVQEGKKYGYIVNGSKSWLITKSESLADEAKQVFGNDVNITCEGKRHLGAVIGSTTYKDAFCEEKVVNWKAELETLAGIAMTQPQYRLHN
ncbi:hypothetical protein AC249_AIPGENE28169 [Exaiptasia diaphana]|nr:hypothetical protein AC249_AIPGENE28169 [Exaiptasia diaphana]